jgi:phosphoribosylglycinamide formyltransferase
MEGRISSTGIMIHNVFAEVDMGTPILVREIPFVKGVDEDLQALEQRIHEVEWKTVLEGIEIAIEQLRDERNLNSHAHEVIGGVRSE